MKKRLNKNGFTLIELLAVIVVLAIVLVVTIPAVLTSIGNSKQQAFQSSANSMASWFESQYSYCKVGEGILESNPLSNAFNTQFNASGSTTPCYGTVTSGENAALFREAGASLTDYTAKVTISATGRACVELEVDSTANPDSKFTGNAKSSGCA